MAAKRKPSPKKARAKSKALNAASRSTQSTAKASVNWVQQNASDWQKSASDWQKGAEAWARESAKLYRLPYGGNQASDMAKSAADQIQSATENAMKMGSDLLQQFTGANAHEAMRDASRKFSESMKSSQAAWPAGFNPQQSSALMQDMMEQLAKSMSSGQDAAQESAALTRENAEAVMEVMGIAVSVSKEMAAEAINFLNKAFALNVELSKQAMACRTLNDLFDHLSRVMKANLDSYFSHSVHMSEVLFQCATDVSEPLNERVSETTERLARVMAA